VAESVDESTSRIRGLAVVAGAVGLPLVLSLGVAYVVSPGGAPQSPNHESWLDQAHTSLDEVSSDIATAQLLLRLAEQDKVLATYQRVVALESESSAGKVAGHLSAEQPEPADQATYTRVTTVLSDAADLLSSTRILLVRGDASQYPRLDEALQKMQQRITWAEGLVPS
jgi:hypothetical protein